MIGWEGIIVQEGMIRVIAEMQLGTILVIVTITTHIKAVHEGLKYLCNDCEYKAATRSSFLQHIKAVHEELKL